MNVCRLLDNVNHLKSQTLLMEHTVHILTQLKKIMTTPARLSNAFDSMVSMVSWYHDVMVSIVTLVPS